MLPEITIGGFTISVYWSMYLLGIVAMAVILVREGRRFGLKTRLAGVGFALILAVVGLLGAKLLYILENLKTVLRDGIELGGVSFFGSVWLIALLMPLLGRAFGLRAGQTLDACSCCVAAMICCMRLGCFFNGCCGADEMTLCGITFTPPVQLLEAAWDGLVTVWLLRGKAEKGMGYPRFAAAYSAFRFFQEFLRKSPKYGLLGLGQWWALLTLLVSLSVLLTQRAAEDRRQGRTERRGHRGR